VVWRREIRVRAGVVGEATVSLSGTGEAKRIMRQSLLHMPAVMVAWQRCRPGVHR